MTKKKKDIQVNKYKTEWYCNRCKREFFDRQRQCPYCKQTTHIVRVSDRLNEEYKKLYER